MFSQVFDKTLSQTICKRKKLTLEPRNSPFALIISFLYKRIDFYIVLEFDFPENYTFHIINI